MWPSCHKSSNKEFCSFVSRTDEGVVEEDLFNVEKFHLNRLIDLLPPTSVLGRLQLQQQQQHALTLPRSVIVSTLWDLLRNRLIPQEFDRQLLLLDLNNKLVEKSLTVKASSSSPKQQMEYVLNTLPTPLPPLPPGNMLNDVFLRLHINSYNNNTQLTETNTIASCCFGAVNKALTTHMPYATTAHATKVAQVANYYQGLQMLKQFINTPPPPTTTTNFTASRNSETTKICFYNNSLDQLNCQSFPSRNLHHELSENRLRRKHSDENIVNDASSDSTKCDNTDNLFPPPKKKWIRHYLREDTFNDKQSLTTSGDNNDTTKQLLLSDHGAGKCNNSDLLHEHDDWQGQQSQHEPEIEIPTPAPPPPPPTSPSFTPKHTLLKPTKFTLMASNGEVIGNVAATNKQMLLASGIRIASSVATKAVNVPQNSRTLTFPLHNTTSTGKPKTFIPLTPPPMSSRKFVEPTHSRIRSFSLSSHKLSANHHQLQFQMHNGNSNNNASSSTNMIVDDVSPPLVQSNQQHSSYSVSLSGQLHSPPRSSVGNHYIQMINSAAVQQATNSNGLSSGTGHVTHVAPRRRTISSNSNGAGTREVHNKLEKNRRAHLKECYEALKNQLSLKDEDRRKPSNLAILGEALKCVQSFQRRNHELEAEWEHLANDKINLQKRIVSLKRELGPKYEQLFSGIFPDIDLNCIPTTSDRENLNETISLSSGRGSTLYSSSSSLSSGGSNGSSNSSSSSNTMSSPVGAGLQTAIPTAISPVINKTNKSNNNPTVNIMNNSNNSATTSPINNNNNNINNNNNNVLHNYRKNATTAAAAMQAITIPTNTTHISPMGSPTALITFGSGGNTGNMPLSLTAKNISATSVTRGSPTPSTPSPSPSSSSGVSSSSSLISSSPPINGVISNCRNVTVNIPNGLKFQATVGALGTTITGTSSGTATTTAASMVVPATNNTNNAVATAPSPNTTPIGHNGRKKSLSLSCSNGLMENSGVGHAIQKQLLTEDGEQPAKFLKVFNNSCSSASQDELNNGKKTKTSIVGGQMQKLVLSGTTGGGGGVGNGSVNELCRLPGGAELNILPRNGIKTSSVATAFYHANGKLTFVNAPPNNNNNNNNSNVTVNSSHHISNITNGIFLKEATSVTPLLVAATTVTSPNAVNSANGIHFSGNFSQLLTAANSTATTGLCQTGNNTIVAVSASPTTPITTSPSALITQNGNITAVAAASPLNNINGKSAISWHTPTI